MTTPLEQFRYAAVCAVAVAGLHGCGGISDLTKDRVARSESVVEQAGQTLGNSESGAVELQRAKNTLQKAQEAVKDKDNEAAQRFAHQAQLDAELAVAKSQSASARKAADELLASIRVLREEANRQTPGANPGTN